VRSSVRGGAAGTLRGRDRADEGRVLVVGAEQFGGLGARALVDDRPVAEEAGEGVLVLAVTSGRRLDRVWRVETLALVGEGTLDDPSEDAWPLDGQLRVDLPVPFGLGMVTLNGIRSTRRQIASPSSAIRGRWFVESQIVCEGGNVNGLECRRRAVIGSPPVIAARAARGPPHLRVDLHRRRCQPQSTVQLPRARVDHDHPRPLRAPDAG
jgi:hypothetical protein